MLDLKPEGYQLHKFKEQVLDLLEEGTREHTITAFWEYILLLEVAYKILEKDRTLHLTDHEIYHPYQELAKVYKEDQYSQEGDFSERMLRLVEQIGDTFKDQHPGTAELRLTREQITELLYVHDIRQLDASKNGLILRTNRLIPARGMRGDWQWPGNRDFLMARSG